MEKGLVSIITPCYNGESFLDRYFTSIISQNYDNIELIFVNDGSNDRTSDVVKKYEKELNKKCTKFVYLEVPHGGQAKAINYGLKYVSGEYLIWPDADDYLSNDSISKRLEFLIKNPGYDYVRSNGYFVESDSLKKIQRISNDDNRFNSDIFMDLINEKTFCACGCYMIKTSLLFDIYPNREIYVSSAGQNWQLLIPYSGRYKCGFIDEDFYYVCVRPNSHSRSQHDLELEFKRLDLLKDVLEKTVALANRDEYDYKYLLEKKYARLKFLKSYQYLNRCNSKIYYKKMKQLKIVTYKLWLMYIELNHINLFRCYLLLKRLGIVRGE